MVAHNFGKLSPRIAWIIMRFSLLQKIKQQYTSTVVVRKFKYVQTADDTTVAN